MLYFILKSLRQLESEHERRKLLIYIFSTVSSLTYVFFATKGLIDGSSDKVTVLFAMGALNIITFVYFRLTRNITVASNTIVFTNVLLALALFLFISKNGTGVYWAYVFQIFSVLLVNYKKGTIYSLALLALILYFGLFPFEGMVYRYSLYEIFRFAFSYLCVMIFVTLAEYTREKTHHAYLSALSKVNHKNDELANAHDILHHQNEELKATQFELDTQKQELEKAYRNITSSIRYAQTIQQATLISDKLLKSWLPESFVLFKPKDVVGGDFYYANKLGNKLLITVADCTGHGVPGAFMTLMGLIYLHEICKEYRQENAGEILDKLRSKIKDMFQSVGTQNNNGMDMSLCVIDTTNKHIEFAGANNPLYLVRNNKLIEYKGSRNPVGFYVAEKPFENQSIAIETGDMVYLCSDGFQDQFGGKYSNKLTRKGLRNRLTEASTQPIAQQLDYLQASLKQWQGAQEQIDDITVLGFRCACPPTNDAK